MRKYISTREKILIATVLLISAYVLSYLSGILFHIPPSYHLVAEANIASLSNAINFFAKQQGRYPLLLDELLEKPADISDTSWPKGGYLKDSKMLYDPWGRKFIYECVINSFTITSYGSDGKQGGDGQDRDISYYVISCDG